MSRFEEVRVKDITTRLVGEGAFAGAPAVYVRFAHCNRKCPWCYERGRCIEGGECSTDFVVGPGRQTVSDVVGEIRRRSSMVPVRPLVVLSGGEPARVDGRVMDPLLHELTGAGYRIHLETNGSLEQPWLRGVTHISLAPVISTTADAEETWRQDVSTALGILERARSAELKVVVDLRKKEDISRAEHLLSGVEGRLRYPVTLQPILVEMDYAMAGVDEFMGARHKLGRVWSRRPLRIAPPSPRP